MSGDRLQQLRALLAEEPGDPFLRYAIALERKRQGDMQGAADDLERIVREDPAYIACYYQLALVLADLDRRADAAETCKAGALQCLVKGEPKARAELLALLASLSGEDDA